MGAPSHARRAPIHSCLQILGLQHGKQYEDVKALRYGSLMIMTDQVRSARHASQPGSWQAQHLQRCAPASHPFTRAHTCS